MATLARIQFGYEKTYTREEQEQIMDLAFIADFQVTDEPQHMWQTVTMLIEDAIKFGSFKVMEILPYHIVSRIDAMQSREASVVNEKCNVIVGGLGTLSIDTVKVELDCCTEHLQDMLDKGWRIIAVNVQPDQRRPDYVLGKTDYKN